MADLRYPWGDEAPQGAPAPPKAATVALVVGERVVWQGEVTEALWSWTLWCALAVVHLWDCPLVVHRYLQTGDQGLRANALSAASQVAAKHDRDAERMAHDAASAAKKAAMEDFHLSSGLALSAVREEARAATWARGDVDAVRVAATDAAEAAQDAHLRTLLLRRALPEDLWPLIDRVAIDGDARVLCDALLERQGG